MRKKTELCLIPLLLAACVEPEPEPSPEQAPAAIGDELMRVEGAWSDCSGGLLLYRDGARIQSQCFGPDGTFAHENLATLTSEASATLDAHLASANLDDTEPTNHEGLCGAADSVGTVTMSVASERISFAQYCVPSGVVPLYEHTMALWTELWKCSEELPELLESIEPGCQ